ncbi:MAG: cellulase family glycosylhydrolase [Chloroflexota bacterium]|nr:cellulase family glycosylhydrolase [Chloroflexota bacterium]
MPTLRNTPSTCFRNITLALLILSISFISSRLSSPAHAQSKGGFVTIQGNQFFYQGKPIKLKGTNFYPKDEPWATMWTQWDGEAARRDLARAAEVGINSVRVLVPYEPDTGWTDADTGEVDPTYLNELRQMVQIAGELNMKVIVALYDFYDPFYDNPKPGSDAEARTLRYLQEIIPTFANDDRVLAWDLHNEPDQYATWNQNHDPATMLDWMGRMAAEIRRLDPNHPLTVGMWQFDNLFVSDAVGAPPLGQQAKGKTAADLSDFLSFHSYNAGNMDWQVHYIKDHNSVKPLVLEETGWPTGPPCQTPDYSESRQSVLYSIMVKAARDADMAGLLQWQLWDLPPGISSGQGKETNEDYFGLLRRDGTWKPAMSLLRDGWPGAGAPISASPLPSSTTSGLSLTAQPRSQPPTDPTYIPPLYFEQTGHYIYAPFRDYWRRFGGLAVFGYPLTEMRLEGDYWVQYFERARFELHSDIPKTIAGYTNLDKGQQLKLLVQLTRLGVSLVDDKTGKKGFPTVEPSQLPAGEGYFPETKHTISGKIGAYWLSHDGLTNFGYPLSEPVLEVSQADGKPYTVQYFERTRLELHPEAAGTPYEIQLGLLGRELLASKGCK